MKELLLNIKNEHKFLFYTNIISIILGLSACIKLFCYSKYVYGLSCLLPIIAILVISFIYMLAYKKFKLKLLTKIIAAIPIFIIITFFQVMLPFFLICFVSMEIEDRPIDDIKNYNKALNSIDYKTGIKHFPNKIPENAQNIEFHKITNSWFGSEAIMLKYSIDKDTIENELKKHQYIDTNKQDKSFAKHEIDAMASDNGRIKFDGFTFYVISDRDNDNLEGHHFLFHYGIGVNDDNTEIIYYYTRPD